ncbi:thermostable hemolysin [Vibrio sp. PP-XX7]
MMQAALNNHSSMTLAVIEKHHPMRHEVEQYVVERYASAFDARIERIHACISRFTAR